MYEWNNVLPEYKAKIINYCKQELESGDGLITNELELAMLTAWLNNSSEVKMPEISDKFELIKKFSDESNETVRVFEKYKYVDGTYYIKCTTKSKEGNIIKTRLAHRSSSLESLLDGNVCENSLYDNNNDGNADFRLISKEINNSESGYKMDMYFDSNLDGKFD